MESYSEILKSLRREAVSVRNRLQSIIEDQRYVQQFQPFALVANERCGLWYVPPHQRADTVYFKSTDGHTGEWRFSERRTNLHLLDLLCNELTVVVVDSTRKGKLLPDALLKTIPIWCAVISYVMFDGEDVPPQFAAVAADNWLMTPRAMVLESEHAAIVAKVPQFAADAVRLGILLKLQLQSRLGKFQPVIPCWRWPSKRSGVSGRDYFSICCVSASTNRREPENWHFDGPYVQGAGDDHELWAGDICDGAFDHDVFWDLIYPEQRPHLRVVDAKGNICLWLSEEELLLRMEQIYRGAERRCETELDITPLGETGIYLGKITENVELARLQRVVPDVTAVVVLSPKYIVMSKEGTAQATDAAKATDAKATDEDADNATQISIDNAASDKSEGANSLTLAKSVSIETFSVESSKKGSKQLREILPLVASFRPCLREPVAILCDTGKDLGVGVVLTLLGRYYNPEWVRTLSPHINKDVIKQHLNHILQFRKINPSRSTLQSVNTFLMSSR